ncbi:DEAD/DEAH box helicase [Streptomyces sp. NPDC088816]|uniref:DEAD/DEAH box helicase n=1 Tax=Streptomyces sp. NPDC088816 TaxID=3365906 RepID=UPI0037F2BCD8
MQAEAVENPTATESAANGFTVAQILQQRWDAKLDHHVPKRFGQPGWTYEAPLPRACPTCGSTMHALRRPYEPNGRHYRYVAVVCPTCPHAYSLADLGTKTYDALLAGTAPTSPPSPPQNTATGETTRRSLHPDPLPQPTPTQSSAPAAPPARTQALLWCKVTDSSWRPPTKALAVAVDIRVIVPAGEDFDDLRQYVTDHRGRVRNALHWVESEQISTVDNRGEHTALTACAITTNGSSLPAPVSGVHAVAARDAFAAQWDALEELQGDHADDYLPVHGLVPQEWEPLLPHPTFNPLQRAAIPALLHDDQHVVIVAPTGAGKTAIGMVAALQAHAQGRKAAWLVPQRSLTDELDQDLERWRRSGLHVVRLTGEAAVDTDLIRDADVWIATTEKFEAICRTASLRAVLAEVGCLVVDEIHLLGDPARGPVLEAVLARVRNASAQVRIVGLSATIANADQVAEWLGARLISSPWRPTRLLWQTPHLPAEADAPDWAARTRSRTQTAVHLARQITADQGSVLLFCGSKPAVRSTALALALDRDSTASTTDPDDHEKLERLCAKAGVRIHYRDWPYKRDAERAFRTREANILVATSTVAAGVNLPARAVIVRDTQIGLEAIEVSMVQQMFGRAGRIGTGEREGFAYLLTAPSERHSWQASLTAGYTVTSRLRGRLTDHLLAEAVQKRIATLREAEHWWTQTLAFHQGDRDLTPLREVADHLVSAGYFHSTPQPSGDIHLDVTDLGKITSRFMVDADLAATVTRVLHDAPVPDDPDTAEEQLIASLANHLPALERPPLAEAATTALRQALRNSTPNPPGDSTHTTATDTKPAPGEVARAVLLLATRNPRAFARKTGYAFGVPVAALAGILDEAQRYLAWLGAQGPLRTVHPWVAITAADLGQRIRWRSLSAGRGAGRLLWMCEQMAAPARTAHLVPAMWRAAQDRGIDAPDWTSSTPPTGCQLTADAYRLLLAARTTGTEITPVLDGVHIRAPRSVLICLWNGTTTQWTMGTGTRQELRYPRNEGGKAAVGAAAFTRSDRIGAGWLSAYNSTGATRSQSGRR